MARLFSVGIYPADLRNKEPIPSLWNRLNVSGIFGVIVQRLPKLANRHPETAVKINERIVTSEAASKFLPAEGVWIEDGPHKRSCIDWCGHLPVGRQLGTYPNAAVVPLKTGSR